MLLTEIQFLQSFFFHILTIFSFGIVRQTIQLLPKQQEQKEYPEQL